jgi:hypothetical protein
MLPPRAGPRVHRRREPAHLLGYRTLVIKMKDGSTQEIDLSRVLVIIFR